MNLESLCKSVCELTHQTGQFILKERTRFNTNTVEIKGLNNFVSYVDKTAEEQLVDKLGKLLPEAGFIAEENTSDKKGNVYNWVIDPLDGTTNFIHGLPCYCISIGLLRDNKPVLGVVHELNFNECFYAWENSKAYMNHKEITVSKASRLSDSLLATGFPYYDYGKLNEYIELFKHFMQHTHGLRRLGSAAADMAYVACGRFEGFYEYGLQPWDITGGAVILRQAGGHITDFRGGDDYLFGKEIIASNRFIHAEFLVAVKKFFV